MTSHNREPALITVHCDLCDESTVYVTGEESTERRVETVSAISAAHHVWHEANDEGK